MSNSLKRINFAKIHDRTEMPNFLEYQVGSYDDFIQYSVSPDKRKNIGLEQIFRDFFPIVSSYGNLRLEYICYDVAESEFPLCDEKACKERSKTYSHSLQLKLRVADSKGTSLKEGWLFVCDMPKMTERGTFIINGTERVVVSQLHRSPGIFFNKELDQKAGREILSAKIIPYKGIWIELEITKDNNLQIKIDRKKKMSFSSFIKAIGFWKSNAEILKTFMKKTKVSVIKGNKEEFREKVIGNFSANDIIDSKTGEVLLEKGEYITSQIFDDIFVKTETSSIEIYLVDDSNIVLANTIAIDKTKGTSDALMELFKKVRTSDIATMEGAKNFVEQIIKSPYKYNLSAVGRYKINKRLGLKVPEDEFTLTKDDFIAMTETLMNLQNNGAKVDDTDSLANKRMRGVGELLGIQIRMGLSKIERNCKEKMAMSDPNTASPQSLLNTKFLYSVIMDFFATGQLSQFMDETNPLSSLSHKRRISSLGPGGLTKARATFDVRDVHSSHYGRICPVATPEGPNIGLISSLATFARVNQHGFIETPYVKVKNGKILFNEVDYLTYDDEQNCFIAQIDTPIDKEGNIITDQVLCRYATEDKITPVDKSQVNYMDISPKQITSVSAALIPFLEHTDANRALTGSNMQRQAVPLIKTEVPYVATGLEAKVARDSSQLVLALEDGTVTYVDASKIIIENTKKTPHVYELMNFVRSNYAMSMTQKPIVNVGDKVKKGDILTDGPSITKGELSLGRNILAAFMPWGGYNFEDAILISERLVKDDVYTSIHIEEYSIETRTSKLGDEIITRELPNIPDFAIADLDENGIVRIGAEVKSGSILVGKITPKGESTELLAEDRLLRAIFGAKARDVRDTSLKMPHGSKGVVVDILELNKDNGDDLPAGVNKVIKVYVAEKRKITVGDKMCGRHGNKGIVSKILPVEDMPYLPDGRSIDIVLNPLGVPSRMNIGQVLEAHLGMAASELGIYVSTPVFDGAKEDEVKKYLKKAGWSEDGKTVLYDGRTGEPFDNKITVGCMYMLKLHHLVEDKMHARAIGPYSLVTQQPLGGKAKFGGQRLGEMEVWALEAHGAANILQEMLTIKSDDVSGRVKAYESIVRGTAMPQPNAPESFKVLIKEFNSLCLDVQILAKDGSKISFDDEESVNKDIGPYNLDIYDEKN
jgi:DNA-directed RNA polymerase subunit beta